MNTDVIEIMNNLFDEVKEIERKLEYSKFDLEKRDDLISYTLLVGSWNSSKPYLIKLEKILMEKKKRYTEFLKNYNTSLNEMYDKNYNWKDEFDSESDYNIVLEERETFRGNYINDLENLNQYKGNYDKFNVNEYELENN
jgi:hypothetical protein